MQGCYITISPATYVRSYEFTDKDTKKPVRLHEVAWLGGKKSFRDSPRSQFSSFGEGEELTIRCPASVTSTGIKMQGEPELTPYKHAAAAK